MTSPRSVHCRVIVHIYNIESKLMEGGQLTVWKGSYGAPSLDATSLQAMAYIKFNAANIKISYGLIPQWAPIPRYKNSKGRYETASDIIQSVHATLDKDVDEKYYSSESSKIEAYKTYTCDVFGLAYQVIFWYNNENYYKVTKPYYYGLIPFPFSYFHLKKLTKYHFDQLTWIASKDLQEEYVNTKMLKAEQCLKDMSETLGQKTFLLGDNPCSLDALVYGFLAPIYFAPLDKCDFQMKLKSYLNLSKYIVRVTKTYFPEVKYQPELRHKKEDEADRAPWWQVTLAGLSAFTVMCWFAYAKGLVRVVP